MRAVSLLLGVAAVLTLLATGCSSAQGDCTYDTDCPGLCEICDTAEHKCVTDPTCEDIKDGKCTSDADCDPLHERCLAGNCVPRQQGGDEDGNDGSDGFTPPDVDACRDPDLDCSAPISVVGPQGKTQGKDVDGDDWGECCDCDDGNTAVNPGRNEIIYNCRDDDCNPATPDDDLDDDGYGYNFRVCNPGTDCDDHDPTVYPTAQERCDGKDNNCDGQTDEDDVCQQPADIDLDGADIPASCPNMAGSYHVRSYCMQFTDFDTTIVQDGCNVSVDIDGIICSGTIDSGLNLYVECGGAIQLACTSKVSVTSSWVIICSTNPQCSFVFNPVPASPDCTYHSEAVCTDNNQLCGVVGVSGSPATKCVNTVPGGREPGYYCNPDVDINCINSLCIDEAAQNYCGGICIVDAHCADFPGTVCVTVTYDDGQGTAGPINVCAPELTANTRCDRSEDCPTSRVCSFRQTTDEVLTVCRAPQTGGAAPGEECNNNVDCETNLCVCTDELCNGRAGTCSEVCKSDADCTQGYGCGTIAIPDLGGTDHYIHVCVRDTDSCGRDADCPSSMSCQLFVSGTGDSLETMCHPGGGDGEPNTGEWCSNGTQCFSVQCFDWPSYCMGLCIGDEDCTDYDSDPYATCNDTDDDCELGYRCYSGVCKRVYECVTFPFVLGFDFLGQPIIDTANICMPDRLDCELDSECRAGEACKLYYNDTATMAKYLCEKGGPGTGQLGDDCQAGAGVCFSGLCLISGGGGPGNEYCSHACISDEDCGDPAIYYCASIQVYVRPGFISYVPACAKRSS